MFKIIFARSFGLGLILILLLGTERSLAAVGGVTAKIEKARELVLKGDRMGAIKALKELHHEATKESVRELQQAWLEVAEIFLSDKGQNQYSLAESIWLQRPKDAVDILNSLAKAEDGNLSVSRLGARAALRVTDCAKAEVFVQQAEQAYAVGPDVRLLRLQLQDCQKGTAASVSSPMVAIEVDGSELESSFRALAVKDALRRKDVKAAVSALTAWEQRAVLRAGDDPEYWYWKWKTSPPTLRDRNAARKYLRLCAEMTPRRRKTFASNPEFCLATETVESELKSSDKAGL